jgi:inner membrane protein
MPTVISHPAVPVAIAMLGGTQKVSGRLLLAAAVASVLPDLDAIGFHLGIPYGSVMGHRGFTHSIVFALLIGLLGIPLASRLQTHRITAFLVLFISASSHGLLDALTNGGLGIAFFSPFSNQRFFFPWHPIMVAPLSVGPFLSRYGWKVLQSEFVWVWLPALAIGSIGLLCRKMFAHLSEKVKAGRITA